MCMRVLVSVSLWLAIICCACLLVGFWCGLLLARICECLRVVCGLWFVWCLMRCVWLCCALCCALCCVETFRIIWLSFGMFPRSRRKGWIWWELGQTGKHFQGQLYAVFVALLAGAVNSRPCDGQQKECECMCVCVFMYVCVCVHARCCLISGVSGQCTCTNYQHHRANMSSQFEKVVKASFGNTS